MSFLLSRKYAIEPKTLRNSNTKSHIQLMIGFLNLEVVTSKIDQAQKEKAKITKVTIIISIINMFYVMIVIKMKY